MKSLISIQQSPAKDKGAKTSACARREDEVPGMLAIPNVDISEEEVENGTWAMS